MGCQAHGTQRVMMTPLTEIRCQQGTVPHSCRPALRFVIHRAEAQKEPLQEPWTLPFRHARPWKVQPLGRPKDCHAYMPLALARRVSAVSWSDPTRPHSAHTVPNQRKNTLRTALQVHNHELPSHTTVKRRSVAAHAYAAYSPLRRSSSGALDIPCQHTLGPQRAHVYSRKP